MKTEIHLHTNRYSGCAHNDPALTMRRLVEKGYEAVYITEHDHVWTDEELSGIRKDFPSLKIYPGIELTIDCSINGVCHLLVLGTNDPVYIDIADDPAEVMAVAAERNHLTILAHPFRWPGTDDLLDIAQPDALEYQTCNQSGDAVRQSRECSEKIKAPLVNAGDIHTLDMIGRFWIDTRDKLASPEDIRRAILERRYLNCSAA